jgi:opacity protein-like surface antigen
MAVGFVGGPAVQAFEATNAPSSAQTNSIWETGAGDGFRRNALALNVSAGPGYGLKAWGSTHHHDWWLAVAQLEWVLSNVRGEGHWYKGNWEIAFELFAGQQVEPSSAYLVGFTPLLRYDFAVGRRWVAFVDGGSGGTLTDIRDGDLSTTFEFNLQAGLGAHYFVRDNLSVTCQARLIHLSNANLKAPNLGVNNVTLMLGVSWWF